MSRTLFKEVNYSLDKLIADIEMGEIALPDLQRPFVWPNTKVRDLIDSMYKGFPVGYFLFWSTTADTVSARKLGTNQKQKTASLFIIDGQQRLTSLFAVMKGIEVVRADFSREKIHISFCPRDERFEVLDAATKRDPEFIPDITEIWKANPMRFTQAFIKNLRNAREVTDAEEDRISEAISTLFELHRYPFTAMELSNKLDEEQVAQVFVRINSTGKPLNQTDFILTLMSVFWEQGRRQLETFARESIEPSLKASPFNYIIQPDPSDLLRVSMGTAFKRGRMKYGYLVLMGKDLETGAVSSQRRDEQFKILEAAQNRTLDLNNWHEFLKVPMMAGYNSEKLISSRNAVMFTYTIWLIGHHEFGVEKFALRRAMARWLFMALLTGRYTGSPESIVERELLEISEIKTAEQFLAFLDTRVTDALTDDFWQITLPGELATSAGRSPSLFAFQAAQIVLGAKALFSDVKVEDLLSPERKSKKNDLERHHLFPKKYLKTIGITKRRQLNQIANFALVEWADNIKISDRAPSTYAPKYEGRFDKGALDEMHYWHALPAGWYDMDYDSFLPVRRKLMAKVIRDAFDRISKSRQNLKAA